MQQKNSPLRDTSVAPPSNSRINGLYLITDGGERLVERVKDALAGGVATLQFRAKNLERSAAVSTGLALKQACTAAAVTFIVNDDVELARILDADGVHLGQDDGHPREARQALGGDKIIGVSTHDLEEAMAARNAGADYLGYGSMYPTTSKDVSCIPGPKSLATIRDRIDIPVVAIGGINVENAGEILDAGADAVAVISAVLGSSDPGLSAAELRLLFNRRAPFPRGSVLTIAGSDSGGGAGIQADLKTITLLGSYCASAITALTAQNTTGVSGVFPASAAFVGDQVDAVLSDIPVDVVKTGMLHSTGIMATVAKKLQHCGRKKLVVVDPVMKAKGGADLMDPASLDIFKETMLPLTYLLTPNIPEAEALVGHGLRTEDDLKEAARMIRAMGARNVLIKGGHSPSCEAVDILFDGTVFRHYRSARVDTANTHGTGCTLSSAIAALLAQGKPLPSAVAEAKHFVSLAIRHAASIGSGHGPVNHFLAAQQFRNLDCKDVIQTDSV